MTAPLSPFQVEAQIGASSPSRMEDMRRQASLWLLAYFWLGTALLLISASFLAMPLLNILYPLGIAGLICSILVCRKPIALQTRLTITVAINALWMFALYLARDVHNGEYMLEVHMLYFISSAFLISYACWRSIVLTTVLALSHHVLMSLVAPSLVWQETQNAWVHVANHSFLGALNCAAGIMISNAIKHYLQQIEKHVAFATYQAEHDALSGLLNRRGLQVAFQNAASLLGQTTSVLMIDLDGFKRVNDDEGHEAGDSLIIEVARRLTDLLPPQSVVARIGGDEFLIINPNTDEASARLLADRIVNLLSQPLNLIGSTVQISASIGLEIRRGLLQTNLEFLMRNADVALYEAKVRGKNQVVLY